MKIIVSTGDIRDGYEVIDAIFALDSSTKSFLSEVEPEQAFEGVKKKLREHCHRLGGHAVINCQFEYRNALADGFLGKKPCLEIFGYGTAVRLLDASVAAEIEAPTLEAWEQEARALVARGLRIEAITLIREHRHLGLLEAKNLTHAWEREVSK